MLNGLESGEEREKAAGRKEQFFATLLSGRLTTLCRKPFILNVFNVVFQVYLALIARLDQP